MTKEQAILASLKQTGWSSMEKNTILYELVYNSVFRFGEGIISVELGVFYGRSLLAMGLAHKKIDAGYVIGFDPYDASACAEGSNSPENNEWWSKQDLNAAYESVQNAIQQNDLADYCIVAQLRSDEAYKQFKDDSIGLLHMDSNHASEVIVKELELWTPKIKDGGFLVADDVRWQESIVGYSKLPEYGYVLKMDFSEWQVWEKV